MASFNLPDLSWLAIADAIFKATMLLGAAGFVSALLRHGSAAARHMVWTLALLASLALPALTLAMPRWQVPLLTIGTESSPAPEPAPSTAAPRREPLRPLGAPALSRTTDDPASAAAPAESTSVHARAFAIAMPDISWQALLLLVWIAGTVVMLARVVLGVTAVYWLTRRTEPAENAPWIRLACRLAGEVGVSSRVRFLRSAHATMPIACGILRPSIVMPADADTWPAERLRIVLLHELAHVKRRDCLTHVLAQIACALYWFNPLAWIAARHVRTERERACDDLVLATGTHGPDYADQLLEIARVMRAGRFPAVLAGASLAMAYRSQLEGRLMAILDPKVPRSGVTRIRATAATTMVALAVLTLASVQPWAYAEPKPFVEQPPQAVAAKPEPPEPQAASPRPAPAPSRPTQSATRHEQDVVQSVVQGTTQAMVQGMTQGVSQGIAQGVTQGVVQGMTQGTIQQFAAVWPEVEFDIDVEQDEKAKTAEGIRAKGADPKLIGALREALKDTDKDVRETAMHALIQLRDSSIYEVLIEALRDAAADVREQAAFGLGQLRDRRAVPALTAALKDAAPDVREQAVFALGQLRDPASVEALMSVVRDANAEVRQQAVFALGQLRDRRAVEPLISALKDTDSEVREQAAFGLGQIRDRGAVEALVIALKDSNAEVREQAAFALGQLRDARAIDGLTAALKDASADVRQQAAFALGQIAR